MNARVHALLPDKQKLLRSRECKKYGCLCSGLPLSIMVKFGGSWLWKPPIPPKEDGCLRLSVQFACQLRVEWLRQVGSRNPFFGSFCCWLRLALWV